MKTLGTLISIPGTLIIWSGFLFGSLGYLLCVPHMRRMHKEIFVNAFISTLKDSGWTLNDPNT